ncbi:MAG: ABC-2 family transporter protein [Nanoarchaeota archaeon]|nr:ABC-2 family transporter protein [Nanoarchaeota archaeon]
MNLYKNFQIIKENIIIGFKQAFEYKANLYSSLIAAITDTFLSIFIFLIFIELTESFSMSINEIIFFILIKQTGLDFFWALQKGKYKVFNMVTKGDFNLLLTRPVNIFILYTFREFKARWLIISILYFVVLFLFVLVIGEDIFKFLFVALFSILCYGYLLISIIYGAESFGFFKINVKGNQIGGLNLTLAGFPPTIFEQFTYRFFLFLFPLILFGVSTFYYFGRISLDYFLFSILIAIVLSIVFNLATYIMWKIGLKKYEAFG